MSEQPAVKEENFAEMLENSPGAKQGIVGHVIEGRVIAIENDFAVVDVGLKSEGRVALKEFSSPEQDAEVSIGDIVEVFLERMENKHGEAVLSREKARREEAWSLLERSYDENAWVTGVIFGRVKGGFTVDLQGTVAFLPGSQIDIRPVRDATPLMGSEQPFAILKMDRARGNIVVSRRAVLEESRKEERDKLISNLHEGQILNGVVKNITDYGAFVDLGGIDGLLHVTDMAWQRLGHPSEAVQVGQTVDVQVLRFNPETQRISLGMKQLLADPWDGIAIKYPAQTRLTGRVTNITDYGAFVELEPGVEGLIHISEMSWTKKNIQPGKIVSTSQEVEIMVLETDSRRRRISLGLKQCLDNPWDTFSAEYSVGTEIEGTIRNITEFGLFIGLPGDIDGMVHMSDLDWNKPGEQAIAAYNKDDTVKVKILDIDTTKERIALGIKQLSSDPFESGTEGVKKGSIVTCTIVAVVANGIEVSIGDGAHGFIRKSDLARDRSEQRPERFAVGERVDAKVTSVEKGNRKVNLSIKAREVEEEQEAMQNYGGASTGASLGDILGVALRSKQQNSEPEDAEDDAEDADSGEPEEPAEDADAAEVDTAEDAPEVTAEAAEAEAATSSLEKPEGGSEAAVDDGGESEQEDSKKA